jgi:hypothetical protein
MPLAFRIRIDIFPPKQYGPGIEKMESDMTVQENSERIRSQAAQE